MNTTVLNCRIDLCDVENALLKVKSALEEKKNFQIITLNPEMISYAQKNKNFLDIINSSDLNIEDGVGLRIALKLRNISLRQIRGIDFTRKLIELAAKEGKRLAILGSKEENLNLACKNILNIYPDLNIVYKRNGYFSSKEDIIKEIKNSNPEILLVGLGSPLQEELIHELKNVLDGCVMIGVGGSLDVFSGVVKESPLIFRRLGLEWLYRTAKEPKRIKRIFPILPLFLIKCIMESNKI